MTDSRETVRGAIRALVAALDDATTRRTTGSVDYRIGGGRWRVRSTRRGGAAAMLAACAPLRMADLAAPDGAPLDLELFVWNDAVDRIALPDSLVLRRDHASAEGQGGFSDAQCHAFYQPDAGVLSVIDFARGRAHWWVRDAHNVPYYERAAPFRHIAQWWSTRRGGALLHAAGVALGEGAGARGVLIAGPSGSGKSSTALACLAAGLGFASDDYVLVDEATPPRARLLYSTAKILRADLPRQRAWESHLLNLARADEKPMMFVDRFAPQAICPSFEVDALVLPHVARGERTSFVPIGGAAMLRALAPSSMLLFPLAGARAFARMAELCTRLPCFRADLAEDANEVGHAFAQFLAQPLGQRHKRSLRAVA
jgi:hypothetical protein